VVGNITTPEIPRAFGGAGGGNTLKDAQIQASFVTPQQTAFGSGTTTYKFASTQAQVTVDEKGGTANLSREQAKKQPGVASDDVVSGAGATYTD
jgi:membrane-bound inhibitor of C-type lysozyme